VFGIFVLFKEIFKEEKIALIGAFLFNFSPVFYYYTMNPLPDVFALSTGLLSLGYFYKFYNHRKIIHIIIAAIFISLSILAKLPYILFGVIPFVAFIQELLKRKEMDKSFVSNVLNAYGLALVPPILWYGWVISDWGTTTIVGGIINTPLTLEKFIDILGFHLTEMWPKVLIGFVSLLFFFFGVFHAIKMRRTRVYWHFVALTAILLAYFMFEFTLIDKVHDYYMMPFLPVFFTLVTYGFKKMYFGNFNLKPILYFLLFLAPVNAYLVINNYWTIKRSYFDETLLSDRDKLRKLVPSTEKCIMLNDISTYVFSYLIDKQGFVFDKDNLPKEWVEDMTKNYGVKYMYSTSRKVDESTEFKAYVDSIIYEKGNVKVIKLKLPNN
jgi:hypothetical protein